MDLNQYSASAAQPGLAVETIAALMVPIPPLEESSVPSPTTSTAQMAHISIC